MSNKINLTEFKETPVVKKLSKSTSNDNLKQQAMEPSKRGRKNKYNTDEERKEARRKQQREYRLRRKQELNKLRELAKDN